MSLMWFGISSKKAQDLKFVYGSIHWGIQIFESLSQ